MDKLPTEPVNKLLNPTADALGKSIGGIAKTILYPFLKWNVFISNNLDDFEKKITEKTNEIDVDSRDPSKIGLAMKAIEESKYQLDSKEMRELFSSLIASTLDKNKNANISPRFAAILSELSPKEAKLLLKIGQLGSISTAHINAILNGSERNTLSGRLLGFSTSETVIDDFSVTTLSSLGLIEIHENAWLTAPVYESVYASMEKSEMFINFSKQLAPGQKLELQRSYISLSVFGTAFLNVVA